MWQKKWILGNWKMNGRAAMVADFAAACGAVPDGVVAGVAVPVPYVQAMRAVLPDSLLCGAQDVSRFDVDGAFTGEVNAAMLADVGAQFVIVGHSERRQYFGEDAADLSAKLQHAQAAGLLPVLCVGETAAEREAGREMAVVSEQLSVLKDKNWDNVVVAYEPVWAIGSGRAATVAQIEQMHAFIYGEILSYVAQGANIRILYGGSVNADNAPALLKIAHVDGALVGGASLRADSFAAIIRAAG